MLIQLKNIKLAGFVSDESEAYSATLYVDGKKLGTVENSGNGGPDHFRPENGQADYDRFNAAEKWSKANNGDSMEMVCAKLLDDHETAKELKRHLRSKILHVTNGIIGTMSWKGCRKLEPKHFAAFAKKYPDATTLNSMPFDAALAAFKEHTQ